MAGDSARMELARMEELAGNLENVVENLRNELARAKTIASELEGAWDDDAQRAFTDGFTEQETNVNKLYDIIMEYSHEIKAYVNDVRETIQRGIRRF